MSRLILWAALLAWVAPCLGDDPLPRLRHTCYLVLVAEEGQAVGASFQCIQHGTYPDWLEYALYDRAGQELTWGQVQPGGQATLETPVVTPGLHVLELASGWNLSTCAPAGLPWAFVVSSRLPLQSVGEVPALFFHVPAGLGSFSIFAHSSVLGEGIRLEILDPNGQVSRVYDGDADALQKITVTVPAGSDDAEWSVRVTRPETPGMHLDDCLLYLSDDLPPFLAPTAEMARALAQRSDWR